MRLTCSVLFMLRRKQMSFTRVQISDGGLQQFNRPCVWAQRFLKNQITLPRIAWDFKNIIKQALNILQYHAPSLLKSQRNDSFHPSMSTDLTSHLWGDYEHVRFICFMEMCMERTDSIWLNKILGKRIHAIIEVVNIFGPSFPMLNLTGSCRK